MAVFEVECVGCGVTFEAKSRRAKWHDPACKKRTERARAKGEESPAEAESDAQPAKPSKDFGGLYDAVYRDLVKAKRLDTVYGQLALELAKDVRVATSKSGVAKTMLEVLAKALEGAASPTPSAPVEKTEEEQLEDELDARRRKLAEKKVRAATGSA